MAADPYGRRVKQVMSHVVITASCDDTIHDVLALMEENRLSAIPIVDHKERCVGIFTLTDLVAFTRGLEDELEELEESDGSPAALIEQLREHSVGHQKVSERMTATVASIDSEASLAKAASEILRNSVHHLPVLDEHQRLIGIISTIDILTAFVEGAPEGSV